MGTAGSSGSGQPRVLAPTWRWLGSTATGGKAPMQVLKGSLRLFGKKKFLPGLLGESVEEQGKNLGHI